MAVPWPRGFFDVLDAYGDYPWDYPPDDLVWRY
jgi:hypothetical protein